MENQLIINDILEVSIFLIEYAGTKTICAKTIQCALRIVCKENKQLCKNCVSEATRICTAMTLSEKYNPTNLSKSHTKCKNKLQEFCQSKGVRLNASAVYYLSGIVDVLEENYKKTNKNYESDESNESDESDKEVDTNKKTKKTKKNTKQL